MSEKNYLLILFVSNYVLNKFEIYHCQTVYLHFLSTRLGNYFIDFIRPAPRVRPRTENIRK